MGAYIPWDEAHLEFLREFVPGHTRKEICEEFHRRFPKSGRTDDAIVSRYKRMKLKTGYTGWFTSEFCVSRSYPIGSLMYKNDRAYVKTAAYKMERLTHFIWRAHGREIPDGYTIGVANDDYLDCRLENLRLVTLHELQELAFRRSQGLMTNETFDVTLAMLRLRKNVRALQRGERVPPDEDEKPRNCLRCGQELLQGETCLCSCKSHHNKNKK